MPGRILIVDDVATNRIVLKVKLSAAHYSVTQCATAAETRRIARAQQTDLILLPCELPDADCTVICRQLKADPATAGIPILLIFNRADAPRRLAALRAGADEIMTAPFEDLSLLARVRNLLRARETDEELERRDLTACEMGFHEAAAPLERAGRVALIGARRDQSVAWKSALRGLARHRIEVMSPAEALALSAKEDGPDLFCIATDLAGPFDGLRLLSELRSRHITRHSAIMMIHPEGAPGDQVNALDLGANSLLENQLDPAEFSLRIDRLVSRKRRADRLRMSVEAGLRLAATDPLTGLFNRRYADHHLDLLLRQAAGSGTEFAFMMVDIDHFKTVNDSFGHGVGDRVLRAVATGLRDNLRVVDLVARYGGEEFLVALPESSPGVALQTADRLRRCIDALVIEVPGGARVKVSVSIGIATGSGRRNSVVRLLDMADRALYRAKSGGRNRVCMAPERSEPDGEADDPIAGEPAQSLLRGPLLSDLSRRSA